MTPAEGRGSPAGSGPEHLVWDIEAEPPEPSSELAAVAEGWPTAAGPELEQEPEPGRGGRRACP